MAIGAYANEHAINDDYNANATSHLSMLYKNLHKRRRARHTRRIVPPTTFRYTPLNYRLQSRAGRSHCGHITTAHRRTPTNRTAYLTTYLPHLLLPGLVYTLLYRPQTGTLKALVKTDSGRHIIIPAVRGLTTGQRINETPTLGSFVPLHIIPTHYFICNVIPANRLAPQ